LDQTRDDDRMNGFFRIDMVNVAPS
jgi:hypothetical protein